VLPPDELYLALYARLKDPRTYHYALHISPNQENLDPLICQSTKFHCKNILQSTDGDFTVITWVYETIKINSNFDSRLLVRVLLGKLESGSIDKVTRLFAEVPVVQDDPEFNCITWVRRALLRLKQSDIVEGDKLEWDKIKQTALDYVEKKKQQGRFETTWTADSSRVPTFDMLLGREVAI